MRPRPAGLGFVAVPIRQAGRRAANSAKSARSDEACTSGESPARISTGPSWPASCVAAHHHGVAGAELLGLLDELDARLAGQLLPNQIGAIADDDQTCGSTPAARTASIT